MNFSFFISRFSALQNHSSTWRIHCIYFITARYTHTLGLISSWFHVQNNPNWDFSQYSHFRFFFHPLHSFLFFLRVFFFSNFTSLKFQREFLPDSVQLWSRFHDFSLSAMLSGSFSQFSQTFPPPFTFISRKTSLMSRDCRNFEFWLVERCEIRQTDRQKRFWTDSTLSDGQNRNL